jgi:hypothetical protein
VVDRSPVNGKSKLVLWSSGTNPCRILRGKNYSVVQNTGLFVQQNY